jgi:mRNA-degrading endonuclease RelE of RelBE toxin-antitoxin system
MFSAAAVRVLRDIPAKDAAALRDKLEAVAAAPFAAHPWAKRLSSGGYRVRHGDWRAIYAIDRQAQAIVVDLIAHRREVYR